MTSLLPPGLNERTKEKGGDVLGAANEEFELAILARARSGWPNWGLRKLNR